MRGNVCRCAICSSASKVKQTANTMSEMDRPLVVLKLGPDCNLPGYSAQLWRQFRSLTPPSTTGYCEYMLDGGSAALIGVFPLSIFGATLCQKPPLAAANFNRATSTRTTWAVQLMISPPYKPGPGRIAFPACKYRNCASLPQIQHAGGLQTRCWLGFRTPPSRTTGQVQKATFEQAVPETLT